MRFQRAFRIPQCSYGGTAKRGQSAPQFCVALQLIELGLDNPGSLAITYIPHALTAGAAKAELEIRPFLPSLGTQQTLLGERDQVLLAEAKHCKPREIGNSQSPALAIGGILVGHG